MAKVFKCSDLEIACNWKGIAGTEEELIKMVADHASSEHAMNEMTDAMLLIIKARIREE